MTYPTSGARTQGWPGQITAGVSVGATNNNSLPGGSITYARITANGSGLGAGLNSISGLSVSVAPTSARIFHIKIQAAYFILAGTGTVTADFGIYNNTTVQSLSSVIISNAFAVGQNTQGFSCECYDEPGAGTTNYIAALTIVANSGSPTVAVGATAATNAFRGASITVTDAGPAY